MSGSGQTSWHQSKGPSDTGLASIRTLPAPQCPKPTDNRASLVDGEVQVALLGPTFSTQLPDVGIEGDVIPIYGEIFGLLMPL